MRPARVLMFALAMVTAAATAPANAEVLITVDKSVQQMTVEVDGVTRWVWPVSTGRLGHDTPSGQFAPQRMEAEHFSKEWDDAPMPHSIFFTQRGHAIHGSMATRHLGSPASHGCVRLSPANATKLFNLVQQQGMPNVRVAITGDVRVAMGRGRGPAVRNDGEYVVANDTFDARPARGTRRSPSPYYEDNQGYQNYPSRFQQDYSYRPYGNSFGFGNGYGY